MSHDQRRQEHRDRKDAIARSVKYGYAEDPDGDLYCTADAMGQHYESVLVLEDNDLYPIEMWIEEKGVCAIGYNEERARN